MVEEKKCCDAQSGCCDSKKITGMVFKVVLGLVFLGLGGLALLSFWADLVVIVKGCIGLFLILAGVITLAIAKE
jgi:hypothetical protein